MSSFTLRNNASLNPVRTDEVDEGIEHKHRIECENGDEYIVKYHDPEREFDALTVARLVGCATPKAYIVKNATICNMDKDDAIAIRWIYDDDDLQFHSYSNEYSRVAILILDFVVDNQDRHNGNKVWTSNRVVPIDHGATFGISGGGSAYDAIHECVRELRYRGLDKRAISILRRAVNSNSWHLIDADHERIARSRMDALLQDLIRDAEYPYDEYCHEGSVMDGAANYSLPVTSYSAHTSDNW